MKLSIIIPLYNEEENVNLLYSNLMEVMQENNYDYELIFINDGSRDATYNLMKALSETNKRVKTIDFRLNFGQTAALMAGIDSASGDILIPMDGDNQNDPKDIPNLLKKIEEGFDVVSGWRKNRQDKTLTRILPSQIANWVISRVGGVSLHDYGCTLKAYKKEVLKPVLLYGEMHRFIPIFAKWQGAKVTEIVVNHHARKFGKTKYGLNRTYKVLLDLLFIVYREKYFKNPIYFFGSFAFLNVFGALFLFFIMLFLKFFEKKSFIETPLPILITLLVLVGVLSLFFGLIAEIQMRGYYETLDKKAYLIRETLNFED
jgi:glycosyltransferase involved in cell wall biosynthesis